MSQNPETKLITYPMINNQLTLGFDPRMVHMLTM